MEVKVQAELGKGNVDVGGSGCQGASQEVVVILILELVEGGGEV